MPHRPFFVAAALVCVLSASPARADIPPPDSCNNLSIGDDCNNAGPAANLPGVCSDDTCTRVDPIDGGSVEYPCKTCVEAGGVGGAGAGGSASGGAAGAAGAAGKTTEVRTTTDEDSGCSLSAAPREGMLASLMLLAGAGALLLGRRRR